MKLKGIAFKTFLFTAALITFVVLITLGTLYYVLPDYYVYVKENEIQKNADELALKLNTVQAEEEAGELISDFCLRNNTNVTSFDENGDILGGLSSPFVNAARQFEVYISKENNALSFTITKNAEDGDAEDNTITYVLTPSPNDNIVNFDDSGDFNQVKIMTEETQVMSTGITTSGIVKSMDITSTLQPIDEAKKVVVSLLPYLLAMDIVVAVIASYFYSRGITAPVIKISRTAALMQEMAPEAECDVKSGDEFGELSQNINQLYKSLCTNIVELQAEKEKAVGLEKSKTDFMQAASHELKTPITALNGIIEGMIDNVGVYKDKEKYLEESKKLLDKLTGIVNEIINASKAESVAKEKEWEEIDIAELIDTVIKDYKYIANDKGLRINFTREPLRYKTDYALYKTAMSNIISNAVKYTEDNGEIDISIVKSGEGAVVSVENQCDNIEQEKLSKLFEPFYTLSYSRDRSKSGTGIGLYIVRKSLEALDLPHEIINTEKGIRFIIDMKE